MNASESLLRREVVESRLVLEQAVGVTVTSFAYPYGARPTSAARRLVGETYTAACATTLDTVRIGSDPHALPRVDAHYVKKPSLLGAALAGSLGPYLRARRVAAGARRRVLKDYA